MRVMVVSGANKQAVSSEEPNRRQIVGVLGEQTSLLLLLDNPNFEAPNLFHAYFDSTNSYRLSNS